HRQHSIGYRKTHGCTAADRHFSGNTLRFCTGTNICRKSTNSWTAKAELPLEIT
ncbi:unnamed protein product, partial [Ectocarpus sp. 12 AP-2014]